MSSFPHALQNGGKKSHEAATSSITPFVKHTKETCYCCYAL